MSDLPPKKNNAAIITTALIMSACFVASAAVLIVFPAVRKLYEKKEALEQKRYFSENIKTDLLKKSDYDDFQKNMDAQKEIISNSLIGNESVVDLIEKVEKIAVEGGNQIVIAQYQPSKKKKRAEEDSAVVPQVAPQAAIQASDPNKSMSFLQIDLYGEYDNFLQFLYRLENMDYALRIDYLQTKVREKKILNLEESQRKGNLQSKIIIGFNVSE